MTVRIVVEKDSTGFIARMLKIWEIPNILIQKIADRWKTAIFFKSTLLSIAQEPESTHLILKHYVKCKMFSFRMKRTFKK